MRHEHRLTGRRSGRTRAGRVGRRGLGLIAATAMTATLLPAVPAAAQADDFTFPETEGDPRIDLKSGWQDAEEASLGVDLLAHRERPEGFVDPDNPAALTTHSRTSPSLIHMRSSAVSTASTSTTSKTQRIRSW